MPRESSPATEERIRDADRSQGTILAAARDEFAEFGLGGARMDRIAERAALNKRLIYYYFADKETLFQAVLEQSYRDIRAAEQQLNLLEVEPAQALRKLVDVTSNYYPEDPGFLPLLTSANLPRARHLQGSRRARELNSPLIEM